MFFDFLYKRQPEQINKEENLISISYSIKAGSPNPIIDINIQDYSDNTINALCKLLDLLNQDICYLETVNMIKTALLEDKQEDILIKIFSHIGQQTNNKIAKRYKESVKDEPCIRPSDMLN